nr:hypothetical protein [Tanacetum cinerariifolium]
EKQIQEDQAANTRYWKIPAYYDDDDDYNFPITPNEPVNSIIMGDKHLDTVPATESDEFIKSSVENLVPNPSESEGENGGDMPACFTTFSNTLFDAEYEFDSVDNQQLHNEDFPKEIFSNPLFDEEINSMRIDQHHFNAEKHKANVSKNETQKEYRPKVSKSKNVGPRESLATPKPRKPRFLLRWSPTGKMFDSASKLAATSGDNSCTSNTLEPKIKRFPNSTSLLG